MYKDDVDDVHKDMHHHLNFHLILFHRKAHNIHQYLNIILQKREREREKTANTAPNTLI